MYEVSPAPFRLNPSPSSNKRKPVMSKEAKQAIQYAEKLKTSTPTTHPSIQPSPLTDQTSISVPREPSSIMSMFSGMKPWQDGFEEGVKMGSIDSDKQELSTGESMQMQPIKSMQSNPVPMNKLLPASQDSSYPRSYPYTNDFYPIPVPVPVEQFPRLENPYQSPVHGYSPSAPTKNPILYPSGTSRESFYAPPSIEDMAHQLSKIQMELTRLRAMDERASYAMEEFVVCVGMGVGILLLLDRIAV